MTFQTKITGAIIAGVLLVIAGLIVLERTVGEDDAEAIEGNTSSKLVRQNSHRLGTAGDGKVTLVEFLDFECESCKAAFPFVEQLRKTYAGKVTFVVRYFPIASHKNAQNAAVAVEAAAKQGKFEQMYKKMYQTQTTWGEQSESKAALFRTFAKDLGLDLARYDRDVASKATLDRVAQDQKDGINLGVEGTPTFFLNGKKLQPKTTEEFTDAIDQALSK